MELPPRLLDTINESRAIVRIGYPRWLRPFLMRDVIAITLGRRIYVREPMAIASLEKLLRHELAHVRQVQRLGLIRFLWRYASEFVRHWMRLRDVSKAYRAISFEIEAWAAEDL